MSTYKNCYELVSSMRRRLNEYSAAKVQGTDTTGAYLNELIVEKINESIRELYGFIARRSPNLFLGEASLTGVNSVFTLPWDFGKLLLFNNDKGRKVYPIAQDERKPTDSTGSDRLYYRKGNTLVLDKSGITKTYDLIYRKKPRNIHLGKASAGAATSITLDVTYAPKIADYFNGMTIENITQDWVDEIDDYTAARVATISETAAANDYYGIVPEIPEEVHHLIAPRATMLIVEESPVGQKTNVSGDEYNTWLEQLKVALLEITDESGDTDWEEMFTSFEPNVPLGSGIITSE